MARKNMAVIEGQEALFTMHPTGEKQTGVISDTWRDHPGEVELPDEFSRQDAQAIKTTGQIELEAQGISRRQAGRILNARAAKRILDETIEDNRRKREAEEQERQRKQDEKILELIRSLRSL